MGEEKRGLYDMRGCPRLAGNKGGRGLWLAAGSQGEAWAARRKNQAISSRHPVGAFGCAPMSNGNRKEDCF